MKMFSCAFCCGFCFLVFVFGFGVLWLFPFWFLLLGIIHGQILDCVRVHLLSFDSPNAEA